MALDLIPKPTRLTQLGHPSPQQQVVEATPAPYSLAVTMLGVGQMRRRELLGVLGGAAATPMAWPLAARGQQAMPVVGLLDPTSPDVYADLQRAFRQGLKETGYVEGENVAIVYRFADNQIDRCRSWRPKWSAGVSS